MAHHERRKIIEQLEASHWGETAAPDSLRIPLSTPKQKIKRLNIDVRKRSLALSFQTLGFWEGPWGSQVLSLKKILAFYGD